MNVQVRLEGPDGRGSFHYVVTTASGYRASMEACLRDLCADGTLTPCERDLNDKHMHASGDGSGSVGKWLKHSASTCHGWHNARVAAFAAKVAKTYGSYRRPSLALLRGRANGGGPTLKDLVLDQLGMDLDEFRAELAKAAA